MTSSLDRIASLTAEIASLKEAAVSELMEKRNALTQQLAAVDSELAELTGKQPEAKKRGRRSNSNTKEARSIPLQELKELLSNAPEKTLNLRKEGLELQNVKTLASANPQLLKIGGKGAWPTVTLLK